MVPLRQADHSTARYHDIAGLESRRSLVTTFADPDSNHFQLIQLRPDEEDDAPP